MFCESFLSEMSNYGRLLHQGEGWDTSIQAIEAVFLSIAGLAAISCLSRADYNLPLFLFIWWVFFHIPDDALTS